MRGMLYCNAVEDTYQAGQHCEHSVEIHLTFMIETFELLLKSCTKFHLLFMNIQYVTAC